ncbi:ABC transporter permease [Candidatus Parcubacteria bacterium]|jgi:ABC-2 type transport system permease protein|nr:MAG: ABC transporter permease [Candidatus Parcubacteria bacterium]
MKTTLKLTSSVFKMFVRNRQALFFTLFMPVLIMTIFGLIGFDRVPKTKVGLVAENPTPATQQFIEQIKNISAFEVTLGKLDDEQTALSKGERAVVIQIPNALIPDPAAKKVPTKQTVTILQNIGQAQQAQTAISVISQLLDKTRLAITQAPDIFQLEIKDTNARNAKYIDFLLPGIVAMSIMQMAVFSVAFVFADYKEKGILKRLIATPMKPRQFVTAQVIVRLFVALVQTAILMAIGIMAYHAQVIGSYPLVFLISVLGGIMFLGLGFTISGLAKTVEAVPAIANLIVFPMLFLSGVFFPTTAMPEWLQHVVNYLPLTHFATALREVMGDGAGWVAIAHHIYWMAGWAVILVGLSVFTFGFEEKRV